MTDYQRPEARAYPLPESGSVGIAVTLWYGAFNASISPDEARQLAIHLCNAANEAEGAKSE